MLKCDQPRGREVADLPPKVPKTQSATRGGQTTMTIMMMMIMMMMIVMTDLQNIVICMGSMFCLGGGGMRGVEILDPRIETFCRSG